MNVIDVAQRDPESHGRTVARVFVSAALEGAHLYDPYVCVEIVVFQDGRGWLLDAQSTMPAKPAKLGTQWNRTVLHETRDAAAEEAAAFFAHARELIDRGLRGEAIVTPGQRLQAACDLAWLDDDAAKALRCDEEELERAVMSADSHAGKMALWARLQEARHQLLTSRGQFDRQWFAAHDWRDFVEGT